LKTCDKKSAKDLYAVTQEKLRKNAFLRLPVPCRGLEIWPRPLHKQPHIDLGDTSCLHTCSKTPGIACHKYVVEE